MVLTARGHLRTQDNIKSSLRYTPLLFGAALLAPCPDSLSRLGLMRVHSFTESL